MKVNQVLENVPSNGIIVREEGDIVRVFFDIQEQKAETSKDGEVIVPDGMCTMENVELVGTFSFDKDNDDWACDEVFTTRDQPFVIECESDWELVETFFISLVNEYLSSGKYAGKLKEYQAI